MIFVTSATSGSLQGFQREKWYITSQQQEKKANSSNWLDIIFMDDDDDDEEGEEGDEEDEDDDMQPELKQETWTMQRARVKKKTQLVG